MDSRLEDDVIMENVRGAMARRNVPFVLTASSNAIYVT